MENFYTLSGRAAEFAQKADELQAQLEEMYLENGGEMTAETEQAEQLRAELERLQAETVAEIVESSDAYAEIVLNKQAAVKVLEAEIAAVKEQQKKVLERYQAKANRLARSIDFWKENFAAAMKIAEITKIGGAKTNRLHSIYTTRTAKLDVDALKVTAPYLAAVETFKATLPARLKVDIDINKTILKKEAELPEGAQLVYSETINVR